MQVSSDLDEDLLLELVWRWQPVCRNIHWFCQQHVSKHLLKVSGHVPLLNDAAVVLDGQDDRKAVEKKGFISLVFLPCDSLEVFFLVCPEWAGCLCLDLDTNV